MTNSGSHFPFLVIGAGGAGSAAAYHLARRGVKPLVLEQFHIGHLRGSGHGHSRIFRFAYDEPDYARMAVDALASWRALEADAGLPLYWRTGGLDLGPPDSPSLQSTIQTVQALDTPAEVLDRAALRQQFPQWHLPAEYVALHTQEAGIVNPTLTIEVLAAMACAHGATVQEHVRVERIELGERPQVHTSAGVLTCERLIVAAGAWLPQLVPALADSLRVKLAATTYYRPPDLAAFSPERFPIFITHDESQAYGFPCFGLPGVKIGMDVFQIENVTTADTRSFAVPELVAQRSAEFMERYLPGAAGPVMQANTCLMTHTPQHDFVMGPHPEHPHVVLASPCSGHGFKFTPLIGEVLAALALGEAHRWALPRFAPPLGTGAV